jgi:hypothetical protein
MVTLCFVGVNGGTDTTQEVKQNCRPLPDEWWCRQSRLASFASTLPSVAPVMRITLLPCMLI